MGGTRSRGRDTVPPPQAGGSKPCPQRFGLRSLPCAGLKASLDLNAQKLPFQLFTTHAKLHHTPPFRPPQTTGRAKDGVAASQTLRTCSLWQAVGAREGVDGCAGMWRSTQLIEPVLTTENTVTCKNSVKRCKLLEMEAISVAVLKGAAAALHLSQSLTEGEEQQHASRPSKWVRPGPVRLQWPFTKASVPGR